MAAQSELRYLQITGELHYKASCITTHNMRVAYQSSLCLTGLLSSVITRIHRLLTQTHIVKA